MRKAIFFWLILLWAAWASAALTPSQLTTLKTAINADPALLALVNVGNYQAVAGALNVQASPTFTVWKSNVLMVEIGKNINGAELGGLTTANHTRLQTIVQISGGSINPSLSDQRAFFDDVFSGAGGTQTRAKLLVLWKRLATRAEKLFASGTGSDASPALLTFEGAISAPDVELALTQG